MINSYAICVRAFAASINNLISIRNSYTEIRNVFLDCGKITLSSNG